MFLPEDLLSVDETVAAFRGKIHRNSVRRWMIQGIGSPPVKLQYVRIGANYYTTKQAIRDFLAATADPALIRHRKTTERCEKAKQRLIKAGA